VRIGTVSVPGETLHNGLYEPVITRWTRAATVKSFDESERAGERASERRVNRFPDAHYADGSAAPERGNKANCCVYVRVHGAIERCTQTRAYVRAFARA